MKSQDHKRKLLQQLPDDRQQIGLADLLAGGNELKLGHAVHRVDVITPFTAILIALVHTVDTDISRLAVGLWGAALADGYAGWRVLVQCRRLPGTVSPAQVVQMGDRDRRQPLEARSDDGRPFHQLLGGGPDTVPCSASMSASKATSVAVKRPRKPCCGGPCGSTACRPGGTAAPAG